MYGIGFGMGQFFFLKYIVVYGLALTWTKAEGYNVPQSPRCVACICLYSDMWRLFDEGLYLFIHRLVAILDVLHERSSLQRCFIVIDTSISHVRKHYRRSSGGNFRAAVYAFYSCSSGMVCMIGYSCGPSWIFAALSWKERLEKYQKRNLIWNLR